MSCCQILSIHLKLPFTYYLLFCAAVDFGWLQPFFLFWYKDMWEFLLAQGLNSILAGCLPLLYLDYNVFNLPQLVLTLHAVEWDVVVMVQDGTHLGDLRSERSNLHIWQEHKLQCNRHRLSTLQGTDNPLTPLSDHSRILVWLNTNTGSKPNKVHTSKIAKKKWKNRKINPSLSWWNIYI